MAANISANDLPPDPDYDPRLDPSAGTLIPSPFLTYTHAIAAYPFDPCNFFKKRMFFQTEHRVGDRPAMVASQKFVVNEMHRLREEEEEAQRTEAMPEVEVELERDSNINDREMWREKLGWAKAQIHVLRRQWCHFYTFVTLSRLLVGYSDRYDWNHRKGRWERTTGYDHDYPRGDYVCRVLEWIDDVRYRIEDEWNATHTAAKMEKKSGRRKRKRTPDDVMEAMKNAPRRRIEPAKQASGGEKEVEVNDLNTKDPGAPEVNVSQSPLQVKDPITGSTDDVLERDASNKLLAEEATARLCSGSEADHKPGAEVRQWLKPDSPLVADSIEADEHWGLPTSPAKQTVTETDSSVLERTGNPSDPITISSDDEVAELAATKISIDLTIDDDGDDAAIAKSEEIDPNDHSGLHESITRSSSPKMPGPPSPPPPPPPPPAAAAAQPSPFPVLPSLPCPPSQPPTTTPPTPHPNRLAIESGFGAYAFLNRLPATDRRMWADFFGERRVAEDSLRNIANLYREPRSREFTRRIIQKVGEGLQG